MGALSSLLEQETEARAMLHYVSTVGWSIGRKLYGNRYLPTFAEMRKGAAVQEHRSGAEIVEDLINKLKKRKEEGKAS